MKKILVFLMFMLGFLSANSLNEIKSSKILRVGVFEAQPPFSQIKENGEFEGFEVDLAKEIAKKIFGGNSGTIEFKPVLASDRLKVLQNNEIDFLIATFTITDERSKVIDFSNPYFAVNIGVVTRKDDGIKTFADLKGKTIIAEHGTTGEVYFRNQGFNILGCDGAANCYKMLKNTPDAAGYASDNTIVLTYAVIDKSLEVNINSLGASDFLGIGVQKGNKEHLNIINDELIQLSKEGYFKKLFDNQINTFYHGLADKKYFLLDDIYKFFL